MDAPESWRKCVGFIGTTWPEANEAFTVDVDFKRASEFPLAQGEAGLVGPTLTRRRYQTTRAGCQRCDLGNVGSKGVQCESSKSGCAKAGLSPAYTSHPASRPVGCRIPVASKPCAQATRAHAIRNRHVSANAIQCWTLRSRAGAERHGGREKTINLPEVTTLPSLQFLFHAKCVASVPAQATCLGLYAVDRSAAAEYIVPPNRDGRVASFSTRSTPASREEFAEPLEADRIGSPRIRPGSLVLHNHENDLSKTKAFSGTGVAPE